MKRKPRLSTSPIWGSMRAYYAAQGTSAWGGAHGVPTLICNNAVIAGSYAGLVRSFVADCGAGDGSPVHVVEIGAGSGAFAHQFLAASAELEGRLGGPVRPIQYVLTDEVPANVEFWATHPRLRAHAAAGRLDRACFDVLGDAPLTLADSGAVLSRETHAAPIVVIANYVIDSLPCDVFRATGGKLHEGSISIESDLSKMGANDPVVAKFSFTPGTAAPYLDEPLDRICAGYARCFDDTVFTFPIAGIQCLRRLARLTSGPVLVIVTDKGYMNEVDLEPISAPSLVSHTGAYSMAVNFDALGKYVASDGGVMLHTTGRTVDLQIAALALRPPADLARTRTTFVQEIDRKGPIEAFQVLLHAIGPETTLSTAISILRLASADAHVTARLGPVLRPLLAEAHPPQQKVLGDLVERAAQLTYPLRGDSDVSLEIGGTLAALERPHASLAALGDSIAMFGRSAAACFASGMCQMMLDQPAEAVALFDQALAIDPAYAPALHWRPLAAERVRR